MNGIQEGHHIRTKFNFVKKIWIKCFVNPYLSGITEPYKKKLGWNGCGHLVDPYKNVKAHAKIIDEQFGCKDH
jgi:hypothetical protein